MRLRLQLRGETATGALWHEAEKGGSARFEPASGAASAVDLPAFYVTEIKLQ